MKSDRPSGDERTVTERMGVRIVSLLLLIAALSVFVLWTVNPVGSGAETRFAVYLAIDLVAFALVAYVRRAVGSEGKIGRVPLIAGLCFILLLVAVGFYL